MNLPRFSAKRLAQADFRRALRDGDEHHVHDTDAADDQRDGCDAHQQRHHHGGHQVHCVRHGFHVDDGVGVILIIENAVQRRFQFVHRRIRVVRISDINLYGGDGGGAQQLFRRAVRYVDRAVRLAAHQDLREQAGVFVLVDHADDGILKSVEIKRLPDGVFAEKQRLGRVAVHQADARVVFHIQHVDGAAASEQIRIMAEILVVVAVDGDRIAPHVPTLGRHGRIQRRRNACDMFAIQNRLQIVVRQAMLNRCARHGDAQRAQTHRVKLGVHGVRRALHNGHQGDDRAHADDDAQRGQKRAHLVARDVGKRHGDALREHSPLLFNHRRSPPRRARRPEC